MDKKEKKNRASIRIYDPHLGLIEEEFGTLQKGVDFFCEVMEKFGPKFLLGEITLRKAKRVTKKVK